MSVPEVAIVGIGIHPFGRHDGVSARAMGVHAVRAALADAGVGWADVDFAYGGSRDGGNADSMVADLGLTGLPFVNVRNGCATGGSALVSAYNTILAGAGHLGVVVGFDKHPPGAFGSDPASYGLGPWYGETGLMVTTQFFGMKIQRYMHDHSITRAALARVAAKAFRNGGRNPNAWRRRALTEGEILASPMIADPLTQYMFCSPGEGGVALVLARGEEAHRYCDRPVYLRSAAVRTRSHAGADDAVFRATSGADCMVGQRGQCGLTRQPLWLRLYLVRRQRRGDEALARRRPGRLRDRDRVRSRRVFPQPCGDSGGRRLAFHRLDRAIRPYRRRIPAPGEGQLSRGSR